MKSGGIVRAAVTVLAGCLLTFVLAGSAEGHERGGQQHARVITDGHLRPGHLVTIRVTGFPGKGITEVSFFPTAICEDECSARSFRGGRTSAKGAARFRVHVPGTFTDEHGHSAYFRDAERIEVNVTWEGPDRSFAVAFAEPDPIIVRTHGSHRG